VINVRTSRKVLLIITNRKKKYNIAIAIFILIFGLVNTLIFAHLTDNPFEGLNIIIDPGHGGIDGGTTDRTGFLEKNINLQLSGELKKILESKKAFVSMTRETDKSLDTRNKASASRHKRDLIARAAQFNSGKYNLFVSIHVNQSASSRAIGPLVMYSPRVPESAMLAQCIQNRLNRHMKYSLDRDIQRLPVKSSNYILKHADIPGVLIEAGFISNPTEKELLKTGSYQEKLVKAIASGIKDYLKKDVKDLYPGGLPPPINEDDGEDPYIQDTLS
jgi:N-acetylmuramoyl-L-alanine amidase